MKSIFSRRLISWKIEIALLRWPKTKRFGLCQVIKLNGEQYQVTAIIEKKMYNCICNVFYYYKSTVYILTSIIIHTTYVYRWLPYADIRAYIWTKLWISCLLFSHSVSLTYSLSVCLSVFRSFFLYSLFSHKRIDVTANTIVMSVHRAKKKK